MPKTETLPITETLQCKKNQCITSYHNNSHLLQRSSYKALIVYLNEIYKIHFKVRGGPGHPPASGSTSNAKMLRMA